MKTTAFAILSFVLVYGSATQAVTFDWATIDNPGNAGDVQSQGTFGAVADTYRISKTEVTNSQYTEFLNAVADTDTHGLYHGRMNISQIVERTIIEQPTVSRIVDQLEREGLAVRETSDHDLRFVEVMLSSAGEAAFEEIYPSALKHQAQALQGFTDEETGILTGFLERIQSNTSSDT